MLITCAYLVEGSAWVMQSLFLAAIADVRERGGKAIEAFGYRYAEGRVDRAALPRPPNGLPERLPRRLRLPNRATPRPRRAGAPGARRSRPGRGRRRPSCSGGRSSRLAGAGPAPALAAFAGRRPARCVALRRDEIEPPALSRFDLDRRHRARRRPGHEARAVHDRPPKPLMPIREMRAGDPAPASRGGRFPAGPLAVGYLAELIEAYFRDGERFGVQLEYLREDQPLGTAGPLPRSRIRPSGCW